MSWDSDQSWDLYRQFLVVWMEGIIGKKDIREKM